MRKVNRFIKSISYLALGCVALTPTVFTSLSSCTEGNKTGHFCIVEQSTQLLQTETQQLDVTIGYIGRHNVKEIKSIELKDDAFKQLWICSSQTDIQLDEKNQFTVNLRLKNEPDKTETINFGFVITFQQGDNVFFQTIENLSVGVDYHTVEWINQSIVNKKAEEYIEYNFQMEGTKYPDKIKAKIVGDQQATLELKNDEDISLNENHQFNLEIKTKGIELPATDNISFELEIGYEIDGQQLHNVLDLSYSYYYVSLQHTKTSSPYLWKDQQIVNFNFTIETPNDDPISKIDRVDMVVEQELETGSFHLLTKHDIPVDKDNNFVISCKYEEIDPNQLFEDTKIHFDLSFTTSSTDVENFHSTPITLKAFREQPYQGTLVRITALDDCDITIMNNGIEDITGYNIQYLLPPSVPMQYNLGASGQSGDVVRLLAGQSVEFKNDTNRWSTGSDHYLSFSFSSPVVVQGDITALLDGKGGQMAELTINNVFNKAFEKTNVVAVSSNFLRATTVSKYCYSYMFDESQLVLAPNLPSTTLPSDAYACMFNGCKYLQRPPEVLPAETIQEWTYFFMFHNCDQLEYSPLIMARQFGTTKKSAFYGMFSNCSLLSTIYLPYWTQTFDEEAFNSWVSTVAAEGVFYYNGTEETRGTSAIPRNWQVEKYE